MAKIKQAVKHTGRLQKEQIVAELVEKLDNSNALVLANYQGLKHKQLEDLKKELKKLNATIVVTKNSLLRISLSKSKNFADYKDNESLDRPTAALFMQADYAEPLKKLAKTIKAFGLPKIKLGILDGQALDEAGVLKIASLPNRETLLSQLVGTLNSPISGLVITLNANIQKLAIVLSAIATNKPQTSEPPQPTQLNPSLQGETLEPQIEAPTQVEPIQPASETATAESDQTTTQPDQPTPEARVETDEA